MNFKRILCIRLNSAEMGIQNAILRALTRAFSHQLARMPITLIAYYVIESRRTADRKQKSYIIIL